MTNQMPHLKKIARPLFFATLTLFTFTSCVAREPAQDQGSEIAQTQTVIDQNSLPQEGVYDNAKDGSPLFAMLNSAQSSLDIEIYEMYDPEVRQKIIAAKKRGVNVRMVMEPQPVGLCNAFDLNARNDKEKCVERSAIIDELKANGIAVVPFSKELCGGGYRCYQHGKLVVVDKKVAMVSTGNFNSSSFCKLENDPDTCNRDYTVVSHDPQIIASLLYFFEKDYAGRKDAPQSMRESEGESSIMTVAGNRTSINPTTNNELASFINSAQKSVKIQAQYLKEPVINDAIAKAAQRGVDVDITIASNCSFTTYLDENDQAKLRFNYQPLLNTGADIRFYTKMNSIKGKPAYMHAKLIIVDDSRAWVGSTNGSPTSVYGNREFGVFFARADWVQKMNATFVADHNSPQNENLETNLKCIKDKVVAGKTSSPDEMSSFFVE